METNIVEADELFANALAWLKNNYNHFRFWTERDLVWTIQRQLVDIIQEQGLPYKVFNDYPMLAGKRRSLSADLVILDENDQVQVTVEFKYEPSHQRDDILPSKFPIVSWGKDGVQKDIYRIREFVNQGKTNFAIAVFIDEGGYFLKRDVPIGSEWRDWGNGVMVLYTKI